MPVGLPNALSTPLCKLPCVCCCVACTAHQAPSTTGGFSSLVSGPPSPVSIACPPSPVRPHLLGCPLCSFAGTAHLRCVSGRKGTSRQRLRHPKAYLRSSDADGVVPRCAYGDGVPRRVSRRRRKRESRSQNRKIAKPPRGRIH